MKKILSTLSIALLFVSSSFAAPTLLTSARLKQNNYAVQAGDLLVSFVAMDAVNGNSFATDGNEILLFQNSDASAHTVTITSIADELGRTDSSLTSYSIPANGIVAIQMKVLNGWSNAGVVTMSTTSALVKVAVLIGN